MPAGHLEAFVQIESAPESVPHVRLHDDGHVVPGRRQRLAEAHVHETHPVLERAAVFVFAAVRVRRQELADQVSVPGVHFYRVEPCFAGQVHGRAESAGHVGDFACAHASHEGGGVDVEARRGRDRRAAADRAVRHVAAVADLDTGGGSLAVDRVGDAPQTGDDLGPQPQLVRERQPVARDRGIGERRHADASGRDAAVILVQHVRRRVAVAHALERGCADRTVAQGQRSDPAGGEQYGFFHGKNESYAIRRMFVADQYMKGMTRLRRSLRSSSPNSSA